MDRFKECPQKYWNMKKFEMKNQSSAFGFGEAFESGCNLLVQGKDFAQAYRKFKDVWTTRPGKFGQPDKDIYDSEEVFYYQSDYDPSLLTNLDLRLIEMWRRELLEKDSAEGEGLNVADEVMERMKSGAYIDKKARQFTHRVVWLCCRRRAAFMLKAFQREVLPQIEEVISVQKEIEMESEDGDKVTGFIDYIVKLRGSNGKPGRIAVMDLKSAGREYDDHSLDSSDQLSSYALAEGISTIGYWVVLKKIAYDVFCDKCGHHRENYRLKNCEKCDKGKYTKRVGKSSVQTLIKEVDDHRLDSVASDYTEIITAIKNNISWKNPHSCMNYGTKCEFYDSCWAGKKLEELEHLKKKDEK